MMGSRGETPRRLSGVFPVVATPFRDDGAVDHDQLAGLVGWLVAAGPDGLVFPGVASEVETLGGSERTALVATVASAIAGRVALVVGVSAADAAEAARYAEQARALGAAAVMAVAPAALKDDAVAIAGYYRRIAAVGVPVMLQNALPPAGCALSPERVAELVASTPGIRYVKEESLPCGQRITRLLQLAPPGLLGVFGGAGGRYLPDELARGACGTMPACELADLHVRQFACHRAADRAGVRALYNRMLPLLNFQAVFRMAMTKEVLRRRGVLQHTQVRAAGPRLDAGDRAELSELLAEIGDLVALPDDRPT